LKELLNFLYTACGKMHGCERLGRLIMSQRLTAGFGVRAGLVGLGLVAAACSAGGDTERANSVEQALTLTAPYRVRAIDFTAFKDSDTVHEGTCGSGPVDQQTVSDNGVTCGVAYTKPGEWLEYSLQVGTAGKFDFVSRMAGNATGKTIRLLIDGLAVGGSLSVPNAGWTAFADRAVNDVALSAGSHTLRVLFETGDTNLNYVDVTPGTATLPQRIEAENYQRAFESTPASNSGTGCNRGDGVDMGSTSDNAGGCLIGWATAGEWLEYDVTVPQSGLFDFTARIASATAARTLQLSVDGAAIGTLTSPSAGYNAFDDRKLQNVSLSAGPHIVRATFVQGDLNLNYIDISVHPVVPGFSFGGTVNYNAFVFQDLSVAPSVAGPVAAGRDIVSQGFSYNTVAAGTIGVLAARNFNGTNGNIQRDLVYGGALSLNSVTVSQGVSRKATPLDFAAEKATLDLTTANLASLVANGTTTISPSGTIYTFSGSDPSRNVFSVNGAALAAGDQFNFSVPATSTAIVNVSGTTAAFDTASFQLGALTPGHLLWNFRQATTVRVTSAGQKGTLLAVNAAVTMSSASLDGALVAGSLSGTNTGITWQPFNGSLAVCSGATLSITPGSPQLVGAPVALSATATCADNRAAEFHFDYLNSDTETTWHEVAPGFGTTTVNWNTSALPPGTYQVRVVVRRVGEGSLSGASDTKVLVLDNPPGITTDVPFVTDFNGPGGGDLGKVPSGWRIDKQANPRTVGSYAAAIFKPDFRAGAALAANAGNGIYSFSSGVANAQATGYWLNSTDRALGWLSSGANLASGGTKSGNLYLALRAPADRDIGSFNIAYDIERYSSGTNATGFRIQLYTSTDGEHWTSAGSDFLRSFAANATNAGFDPAPGQTVNVPATKLTANVLRGTTFYLAWNYTVDSATSVDGSNAQALAIDNVSIQGTVGCTGCGPAYCSNGVLDGDEWAVDCGPSCPNKVCRAPTTPVCTTDADCGAGTVCSAGAPIALGLPSGIEKVCWNQICEGSLAQCGASDKVCGSCLCHPSCANKQCGDDLFDGCNNFCDPVCATHTPGCKSDAECPVDDICLKDSGSNFGLAADADVCVPKRCLDGGTAPNDCGHPEDTCGTLCNPPEYIPCQGMECGKDPQTGTACGNCADGTVCSVDNSCAEPSIPVHVLGRMLSYEVGATPGIHAVNAIGRSTYRIPLRIPPAARNLLPDLELAFSDASSMRGILGPGWSLRGASRIHRCDTPSLQSGSSNSLDIRAQESLSRELCLDGRPLRMNQQLTNSLNESGSTVFKLADDDNTKVVRSTTAGAISFKLFKPDGTTYVYGLRSDERRSVASPNESSINEPPTESWHLAEIEDRFGNTARYYYGAKRQGAEPYGVESSFFLTHIDYAGRHTGTRVSYSRRIKFEYHSKDDALGSTGGYFHLTPVDDNKLLESITVDTWDGAETHTADRIYRIHYEPTPGNGIQRVESIQECTGYETVEKCLPATAFKYDDAVEADGTTRRFNAPRQGAIDVDHGLLNYLAEGGSKLNQALTLDVDGDGLKDLLHVDVDSQYLRFWHAEAQSDGSVTFGAPVDIVGPKPNCVSGASIADLDGDGRDEIIDSCPVARQKQQVDYFNIDASGAITESVVGATKSVDSAYIGDIDGNGRPDIIQETDSHIYFTDFTGYAQDGSMQFGYNSRVDVKGIASPKGPGGVMRQPFMIDVDGDGTKNLMRFDPSSKQFYALRLASDRDLTTAERAQINFDLATEPGGQVVFINRIARWQATGLSYQVSPLTGAPGHFDSIRVMDINGDGLEDVWVQSATLLAPLDPNLFKVPDVTTGNEPNYSQEIGNINRLIGSISNGIVTAGPTHIWINVGGSFKVKAAIIDSYDGAPPDPCDVRTSEGGCVSRIDSEYFRASAVMDYDNDGRDELVVPLGLWHRMSLVSETAQRVHLAVTPIADLPNNPDLYSKDIDPDPYRLFYDLPVFSDFNGDSNLDMLVAGWDNRADRRLMVMGTHQGTGRRLTNVTDGLGNTIDIEHSRDRSNVDISGGCGEPFNALWTTYRPRCLTSVPAVVAAVTRGTVEGEDYGQVTYAYEHPASADFLSGYYFTARTMDQNRWVINESRLKVSGMREEFGQALDNGYYTRKFTYPFLTTPNLRELYANPEADLDGEKRGRTVSQSDTYAHLAADDIPYLAETTRTIVDGSSAGDVQVTRRHDVYTPDNYGLPWIHEQTTYAGPGDAQIAHSKVQTDRATNLDEWLLGNVLTQTETSDRNGVSRTRVVTFDYDQSTGFRTKMTENEGDAVRQLVTKYTPDAFGNVAEVKETSSDGTRITTIDFGARGIAPKTITNAENHVRTFEYDEVWGRPTLIEDENHYQTVQFYDGFGRVIRSEAHNGDDVTLLAESTYTTVHPYSVGQLRIPAVFRRSTTSELFSGTNSEDYDARGLPVRSKTPGVATGGNTPYLYTESAYDWDGHRTLLSDSHAEDEDPVWSWFEYDLRGRAITSGSALGEKHFRYSSLAQLGDRFPEWAFPDAVDLTHITDEEGKQAVAVVDHNGALVASADGVDLDAGNAGFVSRTERSAMDLPTKLIDPEQHETSTEYDADGLISWSDDPSRGKTQYFYDAHRNVRRVIAADNVDSVFHYDRINRVTSRLDNGNEPTGWSYDQDAQGQPKLGRLTEMVGPTGIRTVFGFEDSPRALTTSVERHVGGETFTTTTEFDTLGRPVRVEYPKVHQSSGDFVFAVRPVFDPHSGQVIATQSDDQSTDYWRITDADTRGRVTEVTLGNNIREKYAFDPGSQLLASMQVLDSADNELGSLGYSYYANGQLLERDLTTASVARSRTMTYDIARRLESVTETGPDALDEVFSFSPSGRLTSRTKFGEYTPDAQRPLALGSVAGNEFGYDERGNQKTRNGPDIPGGSQTLSYNRFNLPSQVLFGNPASPDRTVNYEYDAVGSRVVEHKSDGAEVLSLGNEFERTTAGGGGSAVQDKFRIFASAGEVAQLVYDEETGSAQIYYLHRDRQRSVLFTTDGTGQASEVRDFDLFGEPKATPSWANVTSEAFTGHRNDAETGLVNAGARLYDAAFGVFVSADPLRVSGPGSQGFNPYTYANNDPVNFFDPTGLEGEDETTPPSGDVPDWWNNPGTWSSDGNGGLCREPGCTESAPEPAAKPPDGPIGEFIGNGASPGSSLTQQELDRIPSGYAAPSVGTSLTRPEFKIRDTSEFWRKAMNVVVASYNVALAAEGLVGVLATRQFLANAAKIGLSGEVEGVCAAGLCPCFVAGTSVDTDSGGKPIEQVELGDRVGPELDICSSTDFAQWREVDLVMAVNDHGKSDQLELRLLRPDAWIREQGMLQGHVVNVNLDDLSVSGPARVTRLGAWGQVAIGKRCPVTGWVRHTSHDVIPLALEGNETLEVTRHHRLFSADRGTWVHAGDVQDGEVLQTQDGAVRAKHAGIASLPPVEVFNLEVFGAHQYFVGEHRVLAHNVYIAGEAWRVFQPGEAACQSGCQAVAEAIQSEIGGEVQHIVPTVGNYLGPVRSAAGEWVNPAGAKAAGWFDHYVVVNGGRVFDALTGPEGLAISEYKALYQYADAIQFGF